jgi:hypothetical protein
VTGVDRSDYIQKRRRKYLAQVLDFFDSEVVPLIPDAENAIAVDEFRGLCRAKFNALAVDATDVMNLDGYAKNGLADDVRDRLLAERTATARS